MYRVRTAKYYNESQNYNGHHYDSKFEAGYAKQLDFRKKAGEIKSWQPHVKLALYVHGCHVCDYEMDFVLDYPDGSQEFVECKGAVLPLWALKWKILEAVAPVQFPGVKLTVVKLAAQAPRWSMRDVNSARRRVVQSRILGRKAV
jgi:hypothetical protein